MLARVATTRSLPAEAEIALRVLDGPSLNQAIREQVTRSLPPETIQAQGEALVALGLIPPSYDILKGDLDLLGDEVVGFYDPETKAMVLRRGLSVEARAETLAHELTHALQDQLRPLAPLLAFQEGQGDRIAALHSVLEGDATETMFRVANEGLPAGSRPPPSALQQALRDALDAQGAGADDTPSMLRRSLGAPYLDGLRLVQSLRDQGGDSAVNALLAHPPESTEQLLHLDKLRAHEPPVEVGLPPLAELGPHFEPIYQDVLGEQSLRLMLEEWMPEAEAASAAAGWGGDRYVVARRSQSAGADVYALAMVIRMDSAGERLELEQGMRLRFGKACLDRKDLGPLSLQSRGDALALVAGPFRHDGAAVSSAGTCKDAERSASAMLASLP